MQDVPYQPRTSTRHSQTQGHFDTSQSRGLLSETAYLGTGQGEGPKIDFQDQFNKFAESGKKTFTSLFNKAKAKLEEFDSGSKQG